MSRRTRFLIVVVFLVAGMALLWTLQRQKPPVPVEEVVSHAPSPEPEPEEIPEPPLPAPVPATPLPRVARSTATPPPTATAPMPGANPAATTPGTPQERIDQILLSDELSEADKSRKLLEMLPLLPEALQEEAAQHMVNLMPDEIYGQVGPLLTNGVAPEPILDVVMTDLLSRPNTLKLPILLQMARNGEHPRREESLNVLEIYLEQDLGSDWAAWERSMQAYLKENPE